MFDGKRLLKTLEREEKTGITLIFDEIMFTMLTDGWMAETARGRLMDEYREVLGHIVEVLGYIPETECVHIVKVKGEYQIEHPIPEVITEAVCRFKIWKRTDPIQFTGLSYGGVLWQNGLGEIFRCGSSGPNPGGRPVLTDTGILCSFDSDNGEAAYHTTWRPREDISTERELALWAHLESVSWNEWEPAEEEPDEDQLSMELGEEDKDHGAGDH